MSIVSTCTAFGIVSFEKDFVSRIDMLARRTISLFGATTLPALLVWFFLDEGEALAQRAFSVDDLLANEGFGKSALSPNGKFAAIVVIPSREECAGRGAGELVFYEDYLPEEVCGEISIYSDSQTTRIEPPSGALGFFAPQWSPSGQKLALLAFDLEGEAHIWLWDEGEVSKITDRPIDPYVNIDAKSGWDLTSFAWLDDDTLIAAIVSDSLIGADKVPVRHPGTMLIPAWRAQARGTAARAGMLKSKVTRADLPQSTLVKIDVTGGGMQVLATGSYTALSLSPSRDALLVVEAIANLQTAKGELLENVDQNIIPNGFSLGLSHSRIGVINLSQNGSGVSWLPAVFDPWISVIGRRDLDDRGAAFEGPRPTWRNDGERVAFVARQIPSIGASSKLFVHDFSSDRTHEIETSALAPVSITWADDRLVYAQLDNFGAGEGCGAAWCIVDEDGESRNAFDVGRFDADAPKRLYRVGDALWFTAHEALWTLDAEAGRAVRLTDGAFGKVSAISAVSVNGDSVLVEKQENRARLHVIASGSGRHAQYQGVRVLPAPSAAVRAFGGPNGITVTEHAHSKGVDLWVQSESAALATKALSLNRYLSATLPFERERITYEGKDGKRLNGVLLRPAQASKTHQAPLIVRVYPARYANPDLFDSAVNSRLFLSDAMFPGQGYAVLYPTITVTPPAEGGRLCDQFADDVLPTVKAAIEAGGIDPERIVLFGHSFGGYVVNSLMTCTGRGRFTAGIAVAGFSDIFESYWRLPPPYKYTNHAMNADFGFHRAERSRHGVFNMGATPWTNPGIYIENSPVFHADRLGAPLLLMHGEFDAVSIAHSEKMYMAGRRLGKDVTFIRYWGVGHIWRSPENIRNFWAEVFNFLDEKAGGSK